MTYVGVTVSVGDYTDQLFIYPGALGQWLGNAAITPPAPPLAPTALAVGIGGHNTAGVVNTGLPTITATLAAHPSSLGQHVVWQFATDAGFTQNLRTVTEGSISNNVGISTHTAIISPDQRMDTETTWYARAAAIDSYNSQGPWFTGSTFTIDIPGPFIPTNLVPTDTSTLGSSTPTVSADQSAAPDGQPQRLEFLFATNAGFTTGLITALEPIGSLRNSGTGTLQLSSAQRLPQGNWWVKVRSLDVYMQYSAYSAASSFTVVHVPSALANSPSSAQLIVYNPGAGNTFSWTFSDPDIAEPDTQSAYQFLIERNSDNLQVYPLLAAPPVKITSSATSIVVPINPAFMDTVLQWRVKVWDKDNVASAYSIPAVFTPVIAPIVSFTSPSTSAPFPSGSLYVSWTIDAATVQIGYRIVVTKQSDGSQVVDTGIQSVDTLHHMFAPILVHASAYSVQLTVYDNQGLSTTISENFTSYFTVLNIVHPVVTDYFATLGYADIDWAGTPFDSTFTGWHVYKRQDGGPWTLIFETTNPSITNYKDYLQYSSHDYQYAVTISITYIQTLPAAPWAQVIPLSSEPSPSQTLSLISEDYWLLHPTDATMNVRLFSTTADSYQQNIDIEPLELIGRKRKINYGTNHGFTGSLTCALRPNTVQTASEQKNAIEALVNEHTFIYMRSPFGDLFKVSLGLVSYTRIAGTGIDEMLDVQIPYSEVE